MCIQPIHFVTMRVLTLEMFAKINMYQCTKFERKFLMNLLIIQNKHIWLKKWIKERKTSVIISGICDFILIEHVESINYKTEVWMELEPGLSECSNENIDFSKLDFH